jgi:hypothetical protein
VSPAELLICCSPFIQAAAVAQYKQQLGPVTAAAAPFIQLQRCCCAVTVAARSTGCCSRGSSQQSLQQLHALWLLRTCGSCQRLTDPLATCTLLISKPAGCGHGSARLMTANIEQEASCAPHMAPAAASCCACAGPRCSTWPRASLSSPTLTNRYACTHWCPGARRCTQYCCTEPSCLVGQLQGTAS